MWYEITHPLSNHQYQIEVEENEKENTFISNEITHSLSSQQHQNCIDKKVSYTQHQLLTLNGIQLNIFTSNFSLSKLLSFMSTLSTFALVDNKVLIHAHLTTL